MTDKEKILKIMKKNNGIVKTEFLKKENIDKKILLRLLDEDIIERVARGIYRDANNIEDIYYTFQHRCKKAIFSHSTALYFHDLSDRTPIKFMITVPSKYNSRILKDNKYVFSYIKEELYELGKTKVKTPYGNYVYCYDVERTICDIIRDKKKIDPALFTDAMQRYVKTKNADYIKLYEYAERFKILYEVRKYIEVLK